MLTFRERLACTILTKLKHDEKDFLDCKFNDRLWTLAERISGMDPFDLVKKVMTIADNR